MHPAEVDLPPLQRLLRQLADLVAPDLQARGLRTFRISTKTGEGLLALQFAMAEVVEERRAAAPPPAPPRIVLRPAPVAGGPEFSIRRMGDGEGGEVWRVQGDKPERWVRQTDFSNPEAVGYLADRFTRIGIEEELMILDAGTLDLANASQQKLGDPAGVGPEVIVKALEDGAINEQQYLEAVGVHYGTAAEKLDEMDVFAQEAAKGIQGAFADFLFDPFEGGISKMLDNFGRMLQRMAAEAAAAQLARALFGDLGKGGSFGGVLGNLASSFFGSSSGTAGSGGINNSGWAQADAMGGAYGPGGRMAFAMGGVVDRPTAFKFARGGQVADGLMGEAGPEAILPLSRGPGGKLGVRGGQEGKLIKAASEADHEMIKLLADAGAQALVYGAEFAPQVASIRDRLPHLRVLIQVADGSGNPLLPGAVDYESIVATPPPAGGMPTPLSRTTISAPPPTAFRFTTESMPAMGVASTGSRRAEMFPMVPTFTAWIATLNVVGRPTVL